MQARLLGPFRLFCATREVGPWPRPTAKRLLELVLVSPGRHITRDLACEALSPGHGATEANRALIKALSMARSVLAGLGGPDGDLLCSDLTSIWLAPRIQLDVDAEHHEEALKSALAMSQGPAQDDQLVVSLAEKGTLLADEPYADRAIAPRDRLDVLRQHARLALARGRANGTVRCGPAALMEAWEACPALGHLRHKQ